MQCSAGFNPVAVGKYEKSNGVSRAAAYVIVKAEVKVEHQENNGVSRAAEGKVEHGKVEQEKSV